MRLLLFLGKFKGLAGVGLGMQCGQTPVTPSTIMDEIVGGKTAVPYSWPWQVAMFQHILFFNTFECGASILSENFLLTAGHCVYGSTDNPNGFRFKAGVYQKGATNAVGEQKLTAKAIHLHPQYDPSAHTNDVALIELATPVVFSDHVRPVCLPCALNLTAGQDVTVTGWGAESSGALFLPKNLRQVTLPLVSDADCAKDYGAAFSDASMICAGVKGEDSCQGDSGGPMVAKGGDGLWRQYGVVSWGEGCALANYPGVYSRVSSLLDFISGVSGVACV